MRARSARPGKRPQGRTFRLARPSSDSSAHDSDPEVTAAAAVTETLHRRGFARLVARDRRQLSLVDCVSFEFMEEEGIQQALALDRHFEDEGFNTLPSQHRGR